MWMLRPENWFWRPVFGRSARSISDRLILLMVGAIGIVLLLAGGAGLTYLFFEQRTQLGQHLTAQAELLATQTGIAIRKNDPAAMPAILGGLKFIEDVQWAVVMSGGQEFARYGHLPPGVAALRGRMSDKKNVGPDRPELLSQNEQVIVRHLIHDNGHPDRGLLGEIIIAASVERYHARFFGLVAVSIGLALLVIVIVLPVLVLLVRQLTRPLSALAQVADDVTRDGEQNLRFTSPAGTFFGAADEIDRLAVSFNRMLNTLSDRENELAAQARTLQTLNAETNRIREEERTRIAREIHDELGQLLTRLKFDVAWIRQHAHSPTEVESRVGEMALFLDRAVQTVRRISWDLRPGILDTLGLSAAIEWLGEDFEKRTGTPCRVDTDTVPRHFPDDHASNLFRICQELLTNVARHANASEVNVVLDFHQNACLIVEDNGVGMAHQEGNSSTLGLVGIRERIRHLNGELDVLTPPVYQGTSVTVRIPFATNREKEASDE